MKISVENLRRELLPGVDVGMAQHLEEAIRQFITSRDLALYQMMSFQLGWIDENGDRSTVPPRPRLHGQFLLSVAAALSGGDESVIGQTVPYAVPVELLHNYSLIHEDVEDGNTEHNGRPSVWWTWGPAQAINAGDGMHAMARMALFSLSDRGETIDAVAGSLKALDDAAVLMCEGEYLDITMQEQIALSVDRYIEMAGSRSGSLFGASAKIAAIAAGKPELADVLFAYGQLAGTARQVALDHSLFWGGQRLDSVQQGRLLTKKKNLPVAYAVETAPPAIKRQLGEIYMQRVIDPVKVDDVTNLLNEAGCEGFTREKAEQLLTEAKEQIDGIGLDSSARLQLEALANGVAGFSDDGDGN